MSGIYKEKEKTKKIQVKILHKRGENVGVLAKSKERLGEENMKCTSPYSQFASPANQELF